MEYQKIEGLCLSSINFFVLCQKLVTRLCFLERWILLETLLIISIHNHGKILIVNYIIFMESWNHICFNPISAILLDFSSILNLWEFAFHSFCYFGGGLSMLTFCCILAEMEIGVWGYVPFWLSKSSLYMDN